MNLWITFSLKIGVLLTNTSSYPHYPHYNKHNKEKKEGKNYEIYN